MISRRKFLLLSSLGALSTMVPNYLFSKVLPNSYLNDVNTLLRKARRLRKQNKLNQAKLAYQEVLALDPSEVRAYNGIRKILLSKKNKEYEVIQLFEQAIVNIPNNPRLQQRLYAEYLKASLGNKKVLQKLNITGRPLLFVKTKFEALLQAYPERKNLVKQIAKIDKYMTLNIDVVKPHKNKALKEYRRDQRNKYKERFGRMTSQESNIQLTALVAKDSSIDRVPQIREMSKINILALRSEKKYREALDSSLDYLTRVNASDFYFMKQFRKLAKQLDDFDKLISFEQQNHTSKNTFWSALALFDALLRKIEKTNGVTTPQLTTLLQFMSYKIVYPSQMFEVKTREIKLALAQNDLINTKNLLMEQFKDKMGVKDAHSIDRINLLVAKYYIKMGQSNKKPEVLMIANAPESYITNEDEFVKLLALMNYQRSKDNAVHITSLQKSINLL